MNWEQDRLSPINANARIPTIGINNGQGRPRESVSLLKYRRVSSTYRDIFSCKGPVVIPQTVAQLPTQKGLETRDNSVSCFYVGERMREELTQYSLWPSENCMGPAPKEINLGPKPKRCSTFHR